MPKIKIDNYQPFFRTAIHTNIVVSQNKIKFNGIQFNNQLIFQKSMEDYRLQFDQQYQPQDLNDAALQHYRIQINKLEERLADEAATYKKRIAELQSQLYANRKQVIPSEKKPVVKSAQNLSYELYEKDLVIRQLRAENVKLRQIINNPDKVLIRKPDHFETITEKEQQIIKLRKTIQDLEGKHDGQFLSQHKLKKQNQMLLHQVDQLRLQLRNQNRHRMGFNQETLDPELLEAIRYKKELEVCRQELVVYENALKTKQQQLQILRTRLSAKNAGLGVFTQLAEIKMQLQEFRQKNNDLNKVVVTLQQQNEKLIRERDRARIEAQQQVPDIAKKVLNKTEQEEKLIRYYQTKSVAMKSMVPPPEAPTTMRKTDRYDRFQFSDWQSIA